MFNYTFSTVEDAYQQGWLCLWSDVKALMLAEKDPEANGGLIYTTVYRNLQDYVREVCGREKMNSHKTRGITATSAEVKELAVTIDPIEKILANDIATFLSKKLNARDMYVARLFFTEGLTQKEIGKKLQVTESRVSQIISAISNKAARFTN